jgi:ABC-2 type transport system permease protein
MNNLMLRMVSALMPLLERTGVDTYQLYHILRIKLMMDDRRPNAMFSGRRKAAATGKTSNPWVVSLVTVFIGGLVGLVLIAFKGALIAQTVYFAMFMVLMSMTLITDFTSVLLDVRDQYILLSRPVDDRTLAMSRILHISVYVFRLALLQGLGGMVIIGFVDGLPAVPLFIVQLILATFFSILLVNVVYLILMHSVSPEKFKDIISYFQIAFSVVIFGCYYLLPRIIDFTSLVQIDLTKKVWAYFLPPVWIASLNEVLIHPSRATLLTSLLAIIGITVPVAGLWLVAKVLAPGFNKRLAIAATSDGNTAAPLVSTTIGNKKPGTPLVNTLANWLAPDPVENAGFRITWKLAARIREFKIKVYPALAYVPIYFLYFGLNGKGSIDDRLDKIQSGSSYIFLVYLSTFVLSAILQHISYSEKFKPAWVYYALPITQPGKILSGMYKAVVTLYYLPYCFIIGLVSVAIWGPKVINDIILASIVGMIYGMLMALFMVKGLPFSKPVLLKQSGGRVITSLLITGLIGVVGFGHYFLSRWETVIWILIIPAAAAYWIMLYYYKRQGWDIIDMEEF